MSSRSAKAARLALLFSLLPGVAYAQNTCIEEIEKRLKVLSERHETYAAALALAEDFERAALSRFGAGTECHALALSHLGALLLLHGRLSDAGPVLEQALTIHRNRATDRRILSGSLNNLGSHRFWMRQYSESARLHEEALDLRRNNTPVDELDVAESLHNLADAYRYLGRDAKQLYRQSLEIRRRLLPPDDWRIGQSLQNLASALEDVNDYKGAETSLAAALAIYRKSRPDDHALIGSAASRLAAVLFRQGRAKDAEDQFREALRRHRASPGAQRLALAATLDDFSVHRIATGKLDEARSLALEALAIRQERLPPSHPTIARTLSNLSDILWRQRKFGEALDLSRQARDITVALGGLDDRSRFILQRHVGTAWSVFASRGNASPELLNEAFLVGQRAMRTDTAVTVSRMTERFASGDPRLRALLKQVDDIDREQTALDQMLTQAFSLPPDSVAQVFSETRRKLAAGQERRVAVIRQAKAAFPALFRLVTPEPLSVGKVQSLLKHDEVLVSVMAGFQEVYVWAITREKAEWKRARLDAPELEDLVRKLRAGADVDPENRKHDKLPLFSIGLAHELYLKILGDLAPLLRDKPHLLVVPSGPLGSIPFHVLVTGPPAVSQPSRDQAAVYRQADWLLRKHAISVLPSVESLLARERPAQRIAERRPLIGFANPLPGGEGDAATKMAAALPSAERRGARPVSLRGGSPPLWRGAAVDYAALRKHLAAEPLPGTEGELLAVAKSLGASPEDLMLGMAATETAVKKARLADYRVVYFATHGYLAGAFGQGEPSLALTVPATPSEQDDGLLTASEIAQLTLDADWVVLSACSTAAGQTLRAEGLSGLARAFFHAGARSLLVSHWPVSDLDTKELMISTFEAIRENRKLRRSEALRHAMLKHIVGKDPWNAYPGNWAPFVVVDVETD